MSEALQKGAEKQKGQAMTFQEKKQRLQDMVTMDRLLLSRVKELHELQSMLGAKLTQNLEATIEKEMREFQAQREHIREAIDKLKYEQQLVLRLRYIECLQWEEIASTMNYCRSRTFEIHNEAIENLQI